MQLKQPDVSQRLPTWMQLIAEKRTNLCETRKLPSQLGVFSRWQDNQSNDDTIASIKAFTWRNLYSN